MSTRLKKKKKGRHTGLFTFSKMTKRIIDIEGGGWGGEVVKDADY